METITIEGYDVQFERDQPETDVERFRVTAPQGLVDHVLNSRLISATRGVRVPGFRPGHVPAELLRKQHGKQVFPDVVNAIVETCNGALFRKADLVPAVDPQINISSASMGEPLIFDVEVIPLPSIDLSPVDGIRIARLQAAPSDNDLEETLKDVAQSNRDTAPVKKKRPTADDDLVTVDFSGTLDGKELEQAKGQDVDVRLGAGQFIPEFEAALLNRNVKETFTAPVVFPQDYASANLAGKTVEFTITIKELRSQQPAKVDDSLAKRLNLASLEDLRKVVRSNLEQQMQQGIEDLETRTMLDEIHQRIDFPLPQRMVSMEFDSLMRELERAREEDRLSEEEKTLSDDDQRSMMKRMAERRVKLALVLTHVSRQHRIDVTSEEWDRFVYSEAQRSRQPVQQWQQYLRQNPAMENSMRAALMERKILRFLLERYGDSGTEIDIKALRERQEEQDKKDRQRDSDPAPSGKGKGKKASSSDEDKNKKSSSTKKASPAAKSTASAKSKATKATKTTAKATKAKASAAAKKPAAKKDE